jgi:adenylate cyclase class 2
METEIEAKFPDVNPDAIRSKLCEIGAVLEYPEVLMKRKVFDYPDGRLRKIGGWVRVRDEGSKITMSYKQLNDRTLHGTKEVNITVDSFDRACDLVESIGLHPDSYQETKREKWMLGDIEVTIDTWPWVPTFVELEGPTGEGVRTAAEQLDLDWSKAMHGSVETVYQMHYDFTEDEIDHWPSITFVPEPDWLLAKKKS